MDRSPIMLALIPTEKEAGDLHGWRGGLARKSLHEVLGLLTSMYDRHDLQIPYSVYFYTLESWGGKGSERRQRADEKNFLLGFFFFSPYLFRSDIEVYLSAHCSIKKFPSGQS